MKKTRMILMAFCLLVCFSACGKSRETAEESAGATAEKTVEASTSNEDTEQTDDLAGPTEANIVMTKSYEQGRQSYYDTTGIMLPAVANATMADSSCFEEEYACFDITGTYDVYTEIVAFFTDYFDSAPETGMNGNLEKSSWEFETTGGGTDCYEVYWNTEGLIYINYWMAS